MNTPSLTGLTVLAVASLLAGTGCETSHHEVNTVEPANSHYQRRIVEDKRVIRDQDTARSVAVVKVIDGTTPDGLMRVGVEVQNTRTKSFRFNYRFDWFDAQGLPVTTPASTMVSQQIEGGQVMVLSSTAPHPSVKDFKLNLQQSTRDHFPLLPKR